MENLSVLFEEKKAVVKVVGPVNALNATEFEKTVLDELEGKDIQSVVIDADEMNYISSAGLRALFSIMDAVENTSIINVSEELYEIFDVTGYCQMMKVEPKK